MHLSRVERASLYKLVVVDEAHHVYAHSELRRCVKPYADAASHLLLLSDASQSLGALILTLIRILALALALTLS